MFLRNSKYLQLEGYQLTNGFYLVLSLNSFNCNDDDKNSWWKFTMVVKRPVK